MRVEVRDTLPRSRGRLTIAFLPEGSDPAAAAAASVRRVLREACRLAGFRGREKEIAGTRTSSGAWTLVGLGRPPISAGKLRRAVRQAIRVALRGGRDELTLVFGEGIAPESLRMLVREIAQADYFFERYKSRKTRRPNNPSTYVIAPDSSDARHLAALARDAQILIEPVAWARDLGNTPGNDLGPADFAREARKMARRAGLRVSMLGKQEIQREKMGGLLAVSAGSTRPPVFAIGEYRPRRSRGTAVLVGKGITFDSGGISIKPAPSMGEMKYDMMGAATVFACLASAKRLALPVRVVALAPLTENMPGGSATRPGDILRMRSGKTVEVDNTDAEGRLILADALSYAEKFLPDVLLDFATLTGAAIVALGHECAGLMTPDDDLAQELLDAGSSTGERLWRLPLWDDYRENLKSEWADMKNTGGRAAGTINAGVFLKEFVPAGVPWAHIDIAGVAHFEKGHAGYDAGATGFGVALTMEFLRRRFNV